ncbi:MAG: iron-containing alcohol dehydrogenase [Spirochaetes bacterium]|nr:iron-containing alcohol dehydrogenase [Spirochaetota bacterium]
MNFSVSKMPELYFGAGKFPFLTDIILRYGKRALVITGGISFEKSGNLQNLIEHSSAKGIELYFYRVAAEPSPAIIDEAVSIHAKHSIDCVVAIGGGSSIDAGKAISCMLKETGSVADFLEGVGKKKPSGRKLPFIAVPTTAGTGSEATKNAVITERGENGFKKSLRHDSFVPDAALIDPALASTLPSATTAYCALDAFSQLIESYLSDKSNIFTDSLALPSLIRAFDALDKLSRGDAIDIEVRSSLAYCAYISGVTLANAGLGLCHGIAGPMGGFAAIPHGIACANMLVPTLRYSLAKFSADEQKYSSYMKKMSLIGRSLVSSGDSNVDEFSARAFVDRLEKIVASIGVPKLSSFGIDSRVAGKIAEGSDSKNSPVKASVSDFTMMIESMI